MLLAAEIEGSSRRRTNKTSDALSILIPIRCLSQRVPHDLTCSAGERMTTPLSVATPTSNGPENKVLQLKREKKSTIDKFFLIDMFTVQKKNFSTFSL